MIARLLTDPDVVTPATGALVGVACTLLGTFLLLRRMSLLTAAISRAVLLGIVLIHVITKDTHSPLYIVGAAVTGLVTVFLTEQLGRSGRVRRDAAMALVYPVLFAAAIIIVNIYSRNAAASGNYALHIDADSVLFGEIAFIWFYLVPLGPYQVPVALLTLTLITLVNLLFVTLCYKELKLTSFDPTLAVTLGISPSWIALMLLGLTSITAVGAFDAVGAVLVLSFFVVPAAAAYLMTDRLSGVLVGGCLIAALSSLLGYPLAMLADLAIGAVMAGMTGLFLLFALLLSPRYGLLSQAKHRRKERRDHALRLLVTHLHRHPKADLRELCARLHWSLPQGQRVLQRGLKQALLTTQTSPTGGVALTKRGLELAQHTGRMTP